jgi:hypothetical protein
MHVSLREDFWSELGEILPRRTHTTIEKKGLSGAIGKNYGRRDTLITVLLLPAATLIFFKVQDIWAKVIADSLWKSIAHLFRGVLPVLVSRRSFQTFQDYHQRAEQAQKRLVAEVKRREKATKQLESERSRSDLLTAQLRDERNANEVLRESLRLAELTKLQMYQIERQQNNRSGKWTEE